MANEAKEKPELIVEESNDGSAVVDLPNDLIKDDDECYAHYCSSWENWDMFCCDSPC